MYSSSKPKRAISTTGPSVTVGSANLQRSTRGNTIHKAGTRQNDREWEVSFNLGRFEFVHSWQHNRFWIQTQLLISSWYIHEDPNSKSTVNTIQHMLEHVLKHPCLSIGFIIIFAGEKGGGRKIWSSIWSSIWSIVFFDPCFSPRERKRERERKSKSERVKEMCVLMNFALRYGGNRTHAGANSDLLWRSALTTRPTVFIELVPRVPITCDRNFRYQLYKYSWPSG